MDKKIVVAHYEIIVTVPEGTNHRDVIEAWLSSAMQHETLENVIAEDHGDIVAECEIDVTNHIVSCPDCHDQHEMEDVCAFDALSEEEKKAFDLPQPMV